jgi:hypothetical protein
MSTTYGTNLKLGTPAYRDARWDQVMAANLAALDQLGPIAHLAATTHEQPSASLSVDVAPGRYMTRAYGVGTYAGGSIALAASSTKVLYLDATASYALTAAASFPTSQHVRIATVTTGASAVSSIVDERVAGNLAAGT